ncbi:SANT/Myb domain, partial [Dillenia turbinata]
MGIHKQKWTAEEEEALKAGVAKHGAGKWKIILRDPDFAPALTTRSNIDLKDKWRNMSVSTAAQGSKDKVKTPKPKAEAQQSISQSPGPANSLASDGFHATKDEPFKTPPDTKPPPRYNEIIIEALTSMKDSNGSDIRSIVDYIEQRQEVPQNFRRLVTQKLRRLASQGKIEKVENGYMLKKTEMMVYNAEMVEATKQGFNDAKILEAAKQAASAVAEAEKKTCLASKAVEESERVAKMAEDADSMLQLAKEIYEN